MRSALKELGTIRFFIPGTNDTREAAYIHELLREYVAETTTWDLTPRRIYELRYRQEGQIYTARVGLAEFFRLQIIFGILEGHNELGNVAYFLCTEQGVTTLLMPVVIPEHQVEEIVDFTD